VASDRDSGLEGLRLPDDAARRLLARAGELDSQNSGIAVSQLRQAAAEAGISPHAFETALGELWLDIVGAAGASRARARPAHRSLWHPATERGAGPRSRRPAMLLASLVIFATGAATGGLAVLAWDSPPPREVVRAPGRPGAVPSPARSTGGTPYYEFQVEKPVVALNTAAPSYPAALQAQGVTGRVVAQFVVDETGRVDVGTFRVIESSHELFSSAVRAALPRMRFQPAEIAGRRVKQLVQQPFVFQLGR
jgi:TonB family protein